VSHSASCCRALMLRKGQNHRVWVANMSAAAQSAVCLPGREASWVRKLDGIHLPPGSGLARELRRQPAIA